jgi:hypothetical protein
VAVVGTTTSGPSSDLSVVRLGRESRSIPSFERLSAPAPVRDFRVTRAGEKHEIAVLDDAGQVTLWEVAQERVVPIAGGSISIATHRLEFAAISGGQLAVYGVMQSHPFLFGGGEWRALKLPPSADEHRQLAIGSVNSGVGGVVAWVAYDGRVHCGVVRDEESTVVGALKIADAAVRYENDWITATALDLNHLRVAWVRNRHAGGISSLLLQSIDDGRIASSPVEVATTKLFDFVKPRIACSSTGACLIVWSARTKLVAECALVESDGKVHACTMYFPWSTAPVIEGERLLMVAESADGAKTFVPPID